MKGNYLKTEQSPVQIFGLKFVRDAEDEPDREFYRPQILVDDSPIAERLPVNLEQLVLALSQSGTFDIFTYECGEAACRVALGRVRVCQHDGNTDWTYRLAQSTDDFGADDVGRHETWVSESKEIRYTFERPQVIFAVLETLRLANLFHGPGAEYSANGFDRRNIIGLIKTVDALFKDEIRPE